MLVDASLPSTRPPDVAGDHRALPLSVRARTGRAVAGFTAAVVVVLLVVRAALPSAPGVGIGPLLLALVPVLVGNLVVAATPWTDRLGERAQELVLHALAALPPVVLVVGIVLLPDPDPAGLAFMCLAVLFFGLLLPPRSHAAFSLLLVGAGALLIAFDDVGWMALWPTVAAGAVAVVVGAAATLHARALHAAGELATLAERSGTALRAVVDAARASTDPDPQSVLDSVAVASVLIESDLGAILVPTGDGRLRFGASSGPVPVGAIEPSSFDSTLVGEAIERGGTIRWDGGHRDAPVLGLAVDRQLRAAIAIPLLVRRELVGVLVAGRVREGAYDEPMVRALELLAGHAERALSLTRLIDEDRRTMEQLRAMERRQDAFVDTVSHELRTPVTIADGMARTLLEHGAEMDAETSAELLQRLAANTAALSGIVASLLDTAQLRDGLVPSMGRVDLAGLARDAVDRHAPMSTGHEVRVDAPADAVVEGDPDLLERVVDNLLGNAVHHTPPGTVVVVSVRATPRHVTVEVADDGPGIEPELLPSVTQRFVRRHGASATGHRGLGIGLSLAQEILALHESALDVVSTEGVGSRFSFTLSRG